MKCTIITIPRLQKVNYVTMEFNLMEFNYIFPIYINPLVTKDGDDIFHTFVCL